MNNTSINTLVLLTVLSSGSALAASPEIDLAKKHDSLLGGSAAAAKEKLTCPAAWQETAGTSVNGKLKYTMHRCVATEGQVYVADGKVFGLGLRLYSGLDSTRASALYKEAKKGLAGQGCKVTDRGQAAVAQCLGGKALALLENWDSKTDTHTISMIYGQAEVLLPVMGLPVN